jgi:CopG family nickel-responsive transcriptional regulator
MTDLVRMSMTIERPLYDKLNALVEKKGAVNRSEFVRDLIRDRLVAEAWEGNDVALGTVTLLYDHHTRGLGDRLTDIQHDHHTDVLAATHIHLSHDICAEVIIIRGEADRIRSIADRMGRLKGVLHAALSMSAPGEALR